MAGGAQGGRPAQNQGVGTQGAPQVTPQAQQFQQFQQPFQQFQQALQNYRQGAVGMPSQVPGANMAAPGGGMQQPPTPMPQGQGQQSWAGPAVGYPGMQQPPQVSQPMPQGQGPNIAAPGGGSIGMMPGETGRGGPMQSFNPGGGNAAPTPMPMPMPRPMPRPMPQDPRMQQNPRMTPRVSDMMSRKKHMTRPQIQGNPNSMPMQRRNGRLS